MDAGNGRPMGIGLTLRDFDPPTIKLTMPIELEKLQISIDSLFESKIAKNEPVAAVLVSYGGEMIIGKGYGLRDLESKQPITTSTNMRMASVSKQFTALLRIMPWGGL